MSNKVEIFEYRLPDYVACYLINGDSEGLNESELNEINGFLLERSSIQKNCLQRELKNI